MRFVCVVLPRVLARPPWPDDPARADGFRYTEYAPVPPTGSGWRPATRLPPWWRVRSPILPGPPIFAVSTRTAKAAEWSRSCRSRIFRPIRLASGPPAAGFGAARHPGTIACRGGLDATDRACRYSDDAAFASVSSLQRPQSYVGAAGEAATANARISSQINSMLCASRFAHYIKVIGRDMVGIAGDPGENRTTAAVVAERLRERRDQRRPGDPCSSAIDGGPGRGSRASGRPGVFGCTIHLQPHFQLDDMAATFRLVTEVTAPGQRG